MINMSLFISDKRFAYGFAEMFISEMYQGHCGFCGDNHPELFKLYNETVERLVNQFPLPAAIAAYIMLLTGCRHSEITQIKVVLNGDNTKVFIYCPKQYMTRSLTVSRDMGIGLIALCEFVHSCGVASRGEIAQYVMRNHSTLHRKLGTRHNNGAHAFRHLHVSVVGKLLVVDWNKICSGFGWSKFDLVGTYSTL